MNRGLPFESEEAKKAANPEVAVFSREMDVNGAVRRRGGITKDSNDFPVKIQRGRITKEFQCLGTHHGHAAAHCFRMKTLPFQRTFPDQQRGVDHPPPLTDLLGSETTYENLEEQVFIGRRPAGAPPDPDRLRCFPKRFLGYRPGWPSEEIPVDLNRFSAGCREGFRLMDGRASGRFEGATPPSGLVECIGKLIEASSGHRHIDVRHEARTFVRIAGAENRRAFEKHDRNPNRVGEIEKLRQCSQESLVREPSQSVGFLQKGKIGIPGTARSDHGVDSWEKAGATGFDVFKSMHGIPPKVPVAESLFRILRASRPDQMGGDPGATAIEVSKERGSHGEGVACGSEVLKQTGALDGLRVTKFE